MSVDNDPTPFDLPGIDDLPEAETGDGEIPTVSANSMFTRPSTSVDVPQGSDSSGVAGVAEEVARERLLLDDVDTTVGINEAVGAAAHIGQILGVTPHDAAEGAVVGAVHGSGRSGDDGVRIIARSAGALVDSAVRDEPGDLREVVDGALDGAAEVADELGMDRPNAVAAAMAGALVAARDCDTVTFEAVAATVREREQEANPRVPVVEPVTELQE